MQPEMRGGMPPNPSPIPNIQHPPPGSGLLQEQDPRHIFNTSATHVYEQQQRLIQQNQHQHRERQMAAQRGLGVQPGAPQLLQNPQLPTRTASHPAPPGLRSVQSQLQIPASQDTWPHPAIPGQRVPDQQMQYHQRQVQLHQRQQQQQQLQVQQQAMYHLAPGQTMYQVQPQPVPLQQVLVPQGHHMQATMTPQLHHPQAIQRQPSYVVTPTKAPPPASQPYFSTTSAPQPNSFPASAPTPIAPTTSQELRPPSRQTVRGTSPMGPPPAPLPILTSVMQISSSLSAVEAAHPTISPPIRSNTFPLPSTGVQSLTPPDEQNQPVAGTPAAGMSTGSRDEPPSLPSTPKHRSLPEAKPSASRETPSSRVKRHLHRTKRQLATAERVGKVLKGKHVMRKSCKKMGRDEKWRGNFDELVLEYLDRAGYTAAVQGLRLDRNDAEEGSSKKGERSPLQDSVPGEIDNPSRVRAEMKEEGAVRETIGIQTGKVASKTSAGDGNLGKLFMWYTLQRSARQITTALQSSAVREYRLATEISTMPSQPPDSSHEVVEEQATGEAMTGDEPITESAATATNILISDSRVAVRAASSSSQYGFDPSGHRTNRPEWERSPSMAVIAPIPVASPEEMNNLTATLQEASAMRDAQEAQIQAQQSAHKATAAQTHAFEGLHGGPPVHAVVAGPIGSAQGGTGPMYAPMYRMPVLPAQTNWMLPTLTGGMMHPAPMPVSGQPHVVSEVPRGPTPIQGAAKRQIETEMQAGGKKQKLVGKRPTPEEHQRMAVEMGALARAQPPFILHMGMRTEPSEATFAGRRMGEAERQYAAHHAVHARQLAATLSGNSDVFSSTPMTQPQDMLTPPAIEAGPSGGSVQAGAGRMSHKKRPSVLGLDSLDVVVEGEVTPTGGRRKAGKRSGRAPARGKKGKQETPTSVDGPVTPFGQPQTPLSNISHTPTHPPGEFQPEPGPSHPLYSGHGHLPGHQRGHAANTGQLQVSLQHEPSTQQHFSLPPPVPVSGSTSSSNFASLDPDPHHLGGSALDSDGTDHPYSYQLPMDDELIKALNGYANGGLHMADASQATDSSSSGGGGLALAMVNPTSAPFDTMGFEQSNGFDMNSFDWTNFGDEGNG